MKRIARFEKVSFEQYFRDCQKAGADTEDIISAGEIFGEIKLPARATSGSAGYDFFIPRSLIVNPGKTVLIPTGIRVKIDAGWVLKIYPRSSLGFKYRIRLDNTVGIIDGDYYYAGNEGHIIIKLTNETSDGQAAGINKGQAFCQGVFTEYGITYDDDINSVRTGGFGSTDNIN